MAKIIKAIGAALGIGSKGPERTQTAPAVRPDVSTGGSHRSDPTPRSDRPNAKSCCSAG